MQRYWLARLVQAILTCLAVSVGTFLLLHAAPGDPIDMLASPEELGTMDRSALEHSLGLDQPLYVQYVTTMRQLLSGNLKSFRDRRPTVTRVLEALPTTLTLAVAASVLGLILALVVALVSATRPYGWLDHLLTTGALFGMSLPSFWFALILVFLFADVLKWLPPTGIRPATSQVWNLREMLPYLVMPVMVTALIVVPTMARYARSALLDVLTQDFVRVARSKGLPEKTVLIRHALRNTLIPVVTVLGLIVPNLLGGSVVVETVFALPGVGRLAVEAALTRDYPSVITVTMFSAAIVVVFNLLVDFVYTLVDPRIKLGARS